MAQTITPKSSCCLWRHYTASFQAIKYYIVTMQINEAKDETISSVSLIFRLWKQCLSKSQDSSIKGCNKTLRRSLAILFQGAGLSLQAGKESPPHRCFYSTPSLFFLSGTLDGTSYACDLTFVDATATTFSSNGFSVSCTFLRAYRSAEETPAGRGSRAAHAAIVSGSCSDRVGGWGAPTEQPQRAGWGSAALSRNWTVGSVLQRSWDLQAKITAPANCI